LDCNKSSKPFASAALQFSIARATTSSSGSKLAALAMNTGEFFPPGARDNLTSNSLAISGFTFSPGDPITTAEVQ
jgi:hypothetical protein